MLQLNNSQPLEQTPGSSCVCFSVLPPLTFSDLWQDTATSRGQTASPAQPMSQHTPSPAVCVACMYIHVYICTHTLLLICTVSELSYVIQRNFTILTLRMPGVKAFHKTTTISILLTSFVVNILCHLQCFTVLYTLIALLQQLTGRCL